MFNVFGLWFDVGVKTEKAPLTSYRQPLAKPETRNQKRETIFGKIFDYMRFMKQVFLFAALLFAVSSFAQDTTWKKTDTNVVVHKDPRLDMLVKKQAQINEETSRDARRIVKGFRLMIITTANRDEAIAAKTKVYTYFPELKAYLWHQSPYYKLKVGNFKERKEAEAYQKKLNAFFPKGVFIMPDKVEVKPGKASESEIDI
jgi:hypothetical protein